MKVYIGCFGSGLGHVTRMLEVSEELAGAGVEVEFSSSGEVASMIEARGYRCNRLPLADVRYSESGAFQLKQTMADSPAIMLRTTQQLLSEVRNIGRFGPDAVLSDSALPSVIAGKVRRVPTFTVLNQLNLTSSHGHTNTPARLLSVGVSAGMGKLWELSDAVILPDLPPPHTISERNLWGSNVEKTRYVGFLSSTSRSEPDEAAKEFSADRRPKVFWQVSGPPKTREQFLRKTLEVVPELSEKFAFVVSTGNPRGSTVASRKSWGWVYEWCGIASFYFDACDVVVSRAGHGTIGQAITSAKPSLLVPIPRQPEQEGNAEKAERLGVSVVLRQEDLSPLTVGRALETLIGASYSADAKKIGDVAAKFDAKSTIIRMLNSAASHQGPR